MTKFLSYVICATPRSGSTLLCDLLAETGVAGRPDSYYRQQSILHWARDWDVPLPDAEGAEFDRSYHAAARRVGAGETGIFGLRLMWTSVADLSRRLGTLFPGLPDDAARFEKAFGPILYLHLSRQDRIAQAVSRLRAEQTGLWHLAADGSERERAAPPQPVTYDADRLACFQREHAAHDAAWAAWFVRHEIEPLRLTYETLSAEPKPMVARILSALGQDPAVADAVDAKTMKMADRVSLEWAERFRKEGGPKRPDVGP